MEYTIDWIERKELTGGKHLAEVTLGGGLGTVTIWKLDKDGKEFPGFDDLAPGGKVTGTIWTNPTNGKKSLYPPKPASGGFQRRPVVSNEERKKDIKEAQDRKEESIAFFNATNAAIEMVKSRFDLKFGGGGTSSGVTDSTIKENLKIWRDWFLEEHAHYKDKPPF